MMSSIGDKQDPFWLLNDSPEKDDDVASMKESDVDVKRLSRRGRSQPPALRSVESVGLQRVFDDVMTFTNA